MFERKNVKRNLGILLSAVAGLCFGAVPQAHGVVLTVTNLDDDGAGSLRRTIADADPGDIIKFSPFLFLDILEVLVYFARGMCESYFATHPGCVGFFRHILRVGDHFCSTFWECVFSQHILGVGEYFFGILGV